MTMRNMLHRLGADRSGVAMIEFAICAPVLIILTIYSVEAINIAISRLRVEQIASSTADFAARIRSTIDETDIESILMGADVMGKKMDFMGRGRIIISSLEVNPASNGQYIRWQRCKGAKQVSSSYGLEGNGQNNASLQAIGPNGRRVAASDGIPLIFVEIQYDYRPIVSDSLFGAQTFSQVRAFPIRERNDQVLKDILNLRSADKIRYCNRFSAS